MGTFPRILGIVRFFNALEKVSNLNAESIDRFLQLIDSTTFD